MSFPGDDGEEEDSWIPLSTTDQGGIRNEAGSETKRDEVPRVAYSACDGNGTSSYDSNLNDAANRNNEERKESPLRQEPNESSKENAYVDRNLRLGSIKKKLEDRISIQKYLVDHPIDYFWKRCLVNLLRQIWTLDIQVRVGILLLVTGLSARILIWSTWYLLYPRFAILSSILVASLVYLDPFDIQDQIKFAFNFISVLLAPANTSLEQQQKIMTTDSIDTHQLRRLSFILFMIPTLLEIRTFSFLSRINVELREFESSGSDGSWSPVVYVVGVALFTFGLMMFLLKVRRMKPSDVSHRGLLVLYGSSLLLTTYSLGTNNDAMRRIPFLAAPFLTASATLLLSYHDDRMEWLSRIIRHTFRFSLRDVFSSVSERVTENEMLQLAILRWICDFWASNPSFKSTRPESDSEESAPSNDIPTRKKPQESSSGASSNNHPPSSESTKPLPNVTDQIRWEELQPMLNVEIGHMEIEIDAFRHQNNQRSCSRVDLDEKQSNSSNTVQSSSTLGTSNYEKHEQCHGTNSLTGLKSMLLSFNVDERAQPAVVAYRRAVGSIPPKKKTAVAVSIIRRCPAFLTVILHVLFVNSVASILLSTIVLSPFLVIEYYRIIRWTEACQRFAPTKSIDEEQIQDNDWRIPTGLRNLDTMTILLSEDGLNAFRPPSLLLVWRNVTSSVAALEVGLSTARCAETTAVAIEFAGSAMSLVKFGLEISQNGILHGVMVLVREALAVQVTGRNLATIDIPDDGSAEYTSAALRAVHSGQRVVKNIHVLSQDQHVLNVTQPIFQVLGVLIGHRWLWGKEEDDNGLSEIDGTGTESINDLEFRDEDSARIEEIKSGTSSNVLVQLSKTESPQTTNADSIVAEVITNDIDALDDDVTSTQHNLVQKSPDIAEELSYVMEMVALSYEQGLIDEKEKDDFFQKLAELQKEDRFDMLVVSGMKRTLEVVLENGTMASFTSCVGSTRDESVLPSLNGKVTTNSVLPCSNSLNPSQKEENKSVACKETPPKVEELTEKYSNNFLTLGVAALGVFASGVIVTMGINNAKMSDDEQHSTDPVESAGERNEEGRRRRPSSRIEIVNINDDKTEGDWVAIGQK